jgi:hypothetical protein
VTKQSVTAFLCTTLFAWPAARAERTQTISVKTQVLGTHGQAFEVAGFKTMYPWLALLLVLCLTLQPTLAWTQTTALVCTGAKSVSSVGGLNAQWSNFRQTYVFQDGKLDNSLPSILDDNLLSFQLTPSENAACKKFCNHRVVYNVATGALFDVNDSYENTVQHRWEFKGQCRIG